MVAPFKIGLRSLALASNGWQKGLSVTIQQRFIEAATVCKALRKDMLSHVEP
jgi:hypothetical protein